jgi:hypothetical protein
MVHTITDVGVLYPVSKLGNKILKVQPKFYRPSDFNWRPCRCCSPLIGRFGGLWQNAPLYSHQTYGPVMGGIHGMPYAITFDGSPFGKETKLLLAVEIDGRRVTNLVAESLGVPDAYFTLIPGQERVLFGYVQLVEINGDTGAPVFRTASFKIVQEDQSLATHMTKVDGVSTAYQMRQIVIQVYSAGLTGLRDQQVTSFVLPKLDDNSMRDILHTHDRRRFEYDEPAIMFDTLGRRGEESIFKGNLEETPSGHAGTGYGDLTGPALVQDTNAFIREEVARIVINYDYMLRLDEMNIITAGGGNYNDPQSPLPRR